MITACFNPACGKKLDYLREGRVVRVVRNTRQGVEIEHYWLCGECSRSHTVQLLADGRVDLTPGYKERWATQTEVTRQRMSA